MMIFEIILQHKESCVRIYIKYNVLLLEYYYYEILYYDYYYTAIKWLRYTKNLKCNVRNESAKSKVHVIKMFL